MRYRKNRLRVIFTASFLGTGLLAGCDMQQQGGHHAQTNNEPQAPLRPLPDAPPHQPLLFPEMQEAARAVAAAEPERPVIQIDAHDWDILTRTLYGEAEARNRDDAVAIACVIMNRTQFPRKWSASPAEVCQQKWQFSCWNKNDPGRQRILNANESSAWYAECKEIAALALAGMLEDPTNRSTHYYATFVRKPSWAKDKESVHRVGHRGNRAHLFYNDIDTPPPRPAATARGPKGPSA